LLDALKNFFLLLELTESPAIGPGDGEAILSFCDIGVEARPLKDTPALAAIVAVDPGTFDRSLLSSS